MLLMLFYVLGGGVCELLVHVTPRSERQVRAMVAALAVYAIIFMSVLMALSGGITGYVLVILSVYRVFNMLRVIKRRMHEEYLARVTYRTSVVLIAVQCAVIAAAAGLNRVQIPGVDLLTRCLAAQAVLSVVMLHASRRHAARMQEATTLPPLHDRDAPTVTVAIPARNETDDLRLCLESVLASQYPKLEVLVLDDCSQTKRLPDIIRQFAHDGVRFIQGTEPKNGWLAKNQAYQALADSASGEIILFMGVDVRLSPLSIRRMVQYMAAKQKTMLCVMPENRQTEPGLPLLQPMRYFWELALPRRIIGKPPVLSTCWAIQRRALHKAGGFQAASRMVIPEMYLAESQLAHDGYAFIAGGMAYGIFSQKSSAEQRATAVRTAYPLLHRRPELVAMLTLVYIAWLGLPLTSATYYTLTRHGSVMLILATLVCVVTAWAYAIVWRLAYGRFSLEAWFSLPVATLVYVAVLHYSMYKYEFSQVIWKDRNVSMPVMHVIPKLPPL